ncbi:MAG TPA: tryptophan--tRNA ligase [Bacilli bacterium]|nr:tryptophan--tRNA ligase [Bacilli bacterium]
MKVLMTGDRPTGKLHLGHYFGSLQNRVAMQKDYETYILIADAQALTDNFNNPEKVRQNVRELAIDYLSCGIDPKYSHIYIQSMVKETPELTLYFSNLVTVARLFRNPTTKFEANQKENVFGHQSEGITYGFLGYPVNQAADIAVLDGDIVPVGDDQLPHVEQAREIIRKFNNIYGETFKEPQAILSKTPRIKGLDGNDKMGKSLGNAIYLSDSAEEISKKVMGAITDPNKIKKDDKANPNVCMVYYYHKLMNSKNLDTICSECKSGCRGCVACKKELIEEIMNFLKPIQDKRKYYEEHLDEVDNILKEGTKCAQKQAETVMKRVRKNMKIDYFKED